jgi:GDPmannose 4,6-dehydratase
MKRVIITGVTGQDGYLLKKFLEKKKYLILGLSRKIHKSKNIVKTNYSQNSLKKIIDSFKPNEIYNFTGFTNPSDSWKNPRANFFANLNITLNFLEILKKKKNIKFFNASSSEIFAETKKNLDENSKIFPMNPYGIAKSASYFLINAYRKKYGLFLINGILFNHSSYLSKETYLLKYLLSSCNKIKKKNIKKIIIKDSRPIRDFGCAHDFIEYIYQLMQLKKSDNFIISSGKSYSVKQIVQIYKKKFKLTDSNFKFINKLNFKNVFKSRRSNNNKLLKTLKIRSTKKIPEIVDMMIRESKI